MIDQRPRAMPVKARIMLCVLLLVAIAGSVLAFLCSERADTSLSAEDAALSQQSGQAPLKAPNAQALFPDMEDACISSVTVSTPERQFEFHCWDDRGISVNGQKADGEIFLTLLDQVKDSTFTPRDAFTPQDSPLLTLSINTEGESYSAAFYADASSSISANIITGPTDTPQYLTTEAWRVGTLLLLCEGTRIQDAMGQETPLQ